MPPVSGFYNTVFRARCRLSGCRMSDLGLSVVERPADMDVDKVHSCEVRTDHAGQAGLRPGALSQPCFGPLCQAGDLLATELQRQQR